MNIQSDIGKIQEVHIHDNGFKQGNYFSIKFANKDEAIDMDVNADELDMIAVAFLRAAVKSGRWLNICGEIMEILKEGGKPAQDNVCGDR
jgi:tRNA threonylcarbamoyladenosine modification (KEOPS) complex  Pcc1 subunit